MAVVESELIYKANETVPYTLAGFADAIRLLIEGARTAGVPEAPKSLSIYQSGVYTGRPEPGDIPKMKVELTVKWTGEQHIAWATPAPPDAPTNGGEA